MVNILVAEDHAVVRLGISFILHDMFPKVQVIEVTDFRTLEIRIGCPDIQLLLLDINIPGGNHVAMMQAIRRKNPNIPVLILSGYEEQQYAALFLQAGANGYVQKEIGENGLKHAIQTVMTGGIYASPFVRKQLSDPKALQTTSFSLAPLSPREKEIAQLITKGLSSSDISIMLNIGMSTVSTVKTRIFQKLKIQNVAQLIERTNHSTPP